MKKREEDRDRNGSVEQTLRRHSEEGYLPFHMPGHKRDPRFTHLMGLQTVDFTDMGEFDDPYCPSGILKDAEERAQALFKVKCSRLLVGGSTMGNLVAIRTLAREGDAVLVARNNHKSVYNALEINRLRPTYVYPEFLRQGFYGSLSPKQVEEALDRDKSIRLVVLVSPTYEGVISDIASIAEVCRKKDVLLLVDEAHGSHLGLDPRFPQSARALGADIVVNSLHKTLASLTQTAIMHVCSDRVDVGRLDESLAMFQTTSPSYILFSSIDGCIRQTSSEGLSEWAQAALEARRRLANLKHIRLFDGEGVFATDPTRFVFDLTSTDLSGEAFADMMKSKRVELEMTSAKYAIALSAAGDDRHSLTRLAEVAEEIDGGLKDRQAMVPPRPPVPQRAYFAYEADGMDGEEIPLAEAEGRVCAENVWAYPPGCPIVAKGEIFSKEAVDYALTLKAAGCHVGGTRRSENIRVLSQTPNTLDKGDM